MSRPNFVLMFADNLGYGDWGCFGSTQHRTPHHDRMAAEGMKLTHFYGSSPVCTPSRASLMTGCYPKRVSLHIGGHGTCVLMPMDPKGLPTTEITIAKLLQQSGYRTGCIGKWHLGDQKPFLPTRHGFDSYFGVPYSDDMIPRESRPQWPPLPLMRDENVIEQGIDRDLLTKRYTEEAVKFIHENKDQPFFLFLPHAMPGSTDHPFASDGFKGKSANGLYGDSVEEMDWCTGQILDALKEAGVDDNTLVMSTSDHGPIPNDPPQGSAGPLKGEGYTTSERGMRVSCVARWPAVIPAGSECDQTTSVLDVLPTFAKLAGVDQPTDRIIDGFDISDLLACKDGATSPYDEGGFFYYHLDQLQAVRAGAWKLYLPMEEKIYKLSPKGPFKAVEAELYNLYEDISEERNVAAEHPDIVAKLTEMAERARADIGDRGRQGAGQRPAGWIDEPMACVP